MQSREEHEHYQQVDDQVKITSWHLIWVSSAQNVSLRPKLKPLLYSTLCPFLVYLCKRVLIDSDRKADVFFLLVSPPGHLWLAVCIFISCNGISFHLCQKRKRKKEADVF